MGATGEIRMKTPSWCKPFDRALERVLRDYMFLEVWLLAIASPIVLIYWIAEAYAS